MNATTNPEENKVSTNPNDLKQEEAPVQKEDSVLKKTGAFLKNAGKSVGGAAIDVFGFMGKALTIVIVGLVAANLLMLLGVTSLYVLAAIAVVAWGIGYLFTNYKQAPKGDSIVEQQYAAFKQTVNSTKNIMENARLAA